MSRIKTPKTIRRVGNEEKLSLRSRLKICGRIIRYHQEILVDFFWLRKRFFVAAVFTIVGNTSKVVMHLQSWAVDSRYCLKAGHNSTWAESYFCTGCAVGTTGALFPLPCEVVSAYAASDQLVYSCQHHTHHWSEKGHATAVISVAILARLGWSDCQRYGSPSSQLQTIRKC